MELQDYVDILRKRWISVVAITALALGGSIIASLLTTPTYEATTQVFVSVQGGTTTSDLLQGSNFTRQQVVSYTKLVTSPLVLAPVIDNLGLAERTETLGAQVSADSPLNTSLINITVSNPNAALAAATANAIATQFTQVIADLERPSNGGPSAVKVSVVRDAAAPEAPSSPNLKLNIALGLLVGLALGVGLAVLREVLDTRVRDEAGVARVTDTSIIGTIGYDDDAPKHPLIVQSSPNSHRAEAFRRLRTNLQFLDIDDRPQSIVITSSLPQEGKTTTAVNLAITLADAGTRVALVDADLRRPSIAGYMGLEGKVGLTTVLIGRAKVEDVIQPWGNGYLDVLPAGQIPPNPSELLGSLAMAQLLETLTQTHDIVLVDTAPLLPVTDATILAKLTGGAVVVIAADMIRRNQLAQALGALETVDARVLGVVINRQARKQGDEYSYYDYTSEGNSGRTKKPALKPAASERRGTSGRSSASSTTRSGRSSSRSSRTPDARAATPPTGGIAALWPGEPIHSDLADGPSGPERHAALAPRRDPNGPVAH